MKAVITQSLVDKLKKACLRAEVWDIHLQNFYVQIRASGQATYYVRYANAQGERRTYRIGPADILSVTQARKMAQATLAQAAVGADPAEERQSHRACPTLDVVVRDYYLPHARRTKKSWSTDATVLECHILPALGRRPLNQIGERDIENLIHSMRSGANSEHIEAKAGRHKGARPTAEGYAAATCNRVAVLLRYIFNLSINKWKLTGVKDNPARNVDLFPLNNQRQVFLSPEEVGRLLDAGRPEPGEKYTYTLSIVMLLLLTGVRRANALQARWSEFDEPAAIWRIPATKSGKPQNVQLSTEVLNLLRMLPSRSYSEYLFPSALTGRPLASIYRSWNAMRSRAGLAHVRMHDLRHTFASLLVNGGASLFMVQEALGHSNPKITMRYAHLADSTQRAAVQAASTQLSRMLPIQPLAPVALREAEGAAH